HFNAEKIQTALQYSRSKIRQQQTRTAGWFLRFQHGACFVKGVEAVRQLEQIICKDVRTKSVQHLRNDFRELTNPFGKIEFGRFDQNQVVDICSHGALSP